MKSIKATIKEKIRVHDKTMCWLWQGSLTTGGYGTISRGTHKKGRTTVLAHRASYTIFFGEIPAGHVVCHKCDTPACVNPSHLFLGTQKENIHDMIAKGRARFGVGHRPTTFPEQKLIEVANDNRAPAELAAEHGVTISTIYRWRARYAGIAG